MDALKQLRWNLNICKMCKTSLHTSWFVNLVHMENIVPPGRPLHIKVSKKGGPWQGREQSVIGGFGDSFLQVIDSEAGLGCLAMTRWTSLANEGSCLICWGGSVHPGQMIKWNELYKINNFNIKNSISLEQNNFFSWTQAFASPPDLASSGVWENIVLHKTPTFDGVCRKLFYIIFVNFEFCYNYPNCVD